jgi:hypothetical protein
MDEDSCGVAVRQHAAPHFLQSWVLLQNQEKDAVGEGSQIFQEAVSKIPAMKLA